MAETAQRRMSLAEFLGWDDGTDARYELIGGLAVAMAPPLEAHGTIVGNLARHIGNHLEPPCRVVAEAGLVPKDRRDTYYHVDLLVTCAPPVRGTGNPREPLIAIEVLSPSRATHDRRIKMLDYSRMPSIREIVVIDSRERRAQVWHRGDDARWIV